VADPIIAAIIAVSAFLLGAKLLAELFSRLHLPVILGELSAGILIGPIYFAELVQISPLLPNGFVQVNDIVLAFAQIGGIVILFTAGMEMPFREFLKGGIASFTTGTFGVLLPFLGGLSLFLLFGFNLPASLMVAAALTATSIAISVETLRESGQLNTPEGRLIMGAAVADDILAIIVLSVVLGVISAGPASFNLVSLGITIGTVLLILATVLAVSIFLVPRILHPNIWKARGSLETVVTATFFGVAALVGLLGISPVLGSFAVGMALAGANIAPRMQDYVEKLNFIFRPLFFAVIGSQVNLAGITPIIGLIGIALIAMAVVTKIAGCGLPAVHFLKSWTSGRIVGIGMISRGEVGLIVAGLAIASGIVSRAVYSILVLMVIATTIITSIMLTRISMKAVSVQTLPAVQEVPTVSPTEV
jgi:Kef-type K+ transport system membrane component KefB